MRVLVTGHAGYLGPYVVRDLEEAGHSVTGLDTEWFMDRPRWDWPVESHLGDIRTVHEFDVDAVVHLAGLSNDPMGALNERVTRDINYEGTRRMMRLHPTARHLIASSCSVYGTAGLATEETPVAPLTEYARCKAAVDEDADSFNAVSLRFGTLYGYSPGHRLDLVVNKMVYDAARGLGITVNSNAMRPLTHVEDAARAIVFMLERPERGVFNVAIENWNMGLLAQAIHNATGAPIYTQLADGDFRDYAATSAKLYDLGWTPGHGVERTILDLYRQSQQLPDREYVRLRVLERLIASGRLDNNLYTRERASA